MEEEARKYVHAALASQSTVRSPSSQAPRFELRSDTARMEAAARAFARSEELKRGPLEVQHHDRQSLGQGMARESDAMLSGDAEQRAPDPDAAWHARKAAVNKEHEAWRQKYSEARKDLIANIQEQITEREHQREARSLASIDALRNAVHKWEEVSTLAPASGTVISRFHARVESCLPLLSM